VAINGSGPVREVESRASDFNVDGPWELSFRPAGPDWREWHFEVSHRRDGHSPQDNRNRRESVILGNGGAPLWHQSGRELYFRTADSLYVVRLPDQGTKGITRDAYSLVKQFPTPARWPPDFDVFPDGRRFAMIKHGDPVVEIQVALNWFEQVKALFEKK
jgi:hypothetical protein